MELELGLLIGAAKTRSKTHPINRGCGTLRVFLVFGGVESATFQGDRKIVGRVRSKDGQV